LLAEIAEGAELDAEPLRGVELIGEPCVEHPVGGGPKTVTALAETRDGIDQDLLLALLTAVRAFGEAEQVLRVDILLLVGFAALPPRATVVRRGFRLVILRLLGKPRGRSEAQGQQHGDGGVRDASCQHSVPDHHPATFPD
jgi:hypothetical protein